MGNFNQGYMADLIRRPYLSSVVKAIRGPEAGSDPRNTIPIVGFPKPMASILPDAELTALSFADGANGLDFPSKGSVTVIVLHGPQPRPGSCPAGFMAIAGLRW